MIYLVLSACVLLCLLVSCDVGGACLMDAFGLMFGCMCIVLVCCWLAVVVCLRCCVLIMNYVFVGLGTD